MNPVRLWTGPGRQHPNGHVNPIRPVHPIRTVRQVRQVRVVRLVRRICPRPRDRSSNRAMNPGLGLNGVKGQNSLNVR